MWVPTVVNLLPSWCLIFFHSGIHIFKDYLLTIKWQPGLLKAEIQAISQKDTRTRENLFLLNNDTDSDWEDLVTFKISLGLVLSENTSVVVGWGYLCVTGLFDSFLVLWVVISEKEIKS